MKKYLLIASFLLTNNAYAQLIIDNLQIESTERNGQIKITNISNKPIDKIIMNGEILPTEIRVLEPNESRIFIFTAKTKEQILTEEKRKKALADILKDH